MLRKCCHENNSNTTANSSIPKTIGLSIPSKNWNNLDKQNIFGVEAIKQSILADNYSPVVNTKSCSMLTQGLDKDLSVSAQVLYEKNLP